MLNSNVVVEIPRVNAKVRHIRTMVHSDECRIFAKKLRTDNESVCCMFCDNLHYSLLHLRMEHRWNGLDWSKVLRWCFLLSAHLILVLKITIGFHSRG